MLVKLDDIEGFKRGTQLTVLEGDNKNRSFVRIEEYFGFEDSWVELGTGRIWHYTKIIGSDESVEVSIIPKRR